jgi:acyl-CoA synthetase (AMP-forming)/AMP-acid ligase II
MSSQSDSAGTGVASPWPARTRVSRTELDPTSFLHRAATIHPDRVAVVDGDVRRSYAQLRERVNRLCSTLRARGLQRHDRVAALCPNVPELLELHHAVPAAGGENISSIEVEQAICAHPAVLEAAVVAVPSDRWGARPKAFVTLRPGTEVGEQELIAFCRERLAHFKCPDAIAFGPLPKTSTGKVQKFALREPEWAGRRRRIN